jgi:hypothetical protein
LGLGKAAPGPYGLVNAGVVKLVDALDSKAIPINHLRQKALVFIGDFRIMKLRRR